MQSFCSRSLSPVNFLLDPFAFALIVAGVDAEANMGLLPNNRSDIHFHWLICLIVFISDFLQVWVLDSNPGLLPKDKSDVARVMDEVGDIRMPARSREAVLAHLQVISLCFMTASHRQILPVSHGRGGEHPDAGTVARGRACAPAGTDCALDQCSERLSVTCRNQVGASGDFWEMPARSAWSCLRICTLQCCQGSHVLFGPLLV